MRALLLFVVLLLSATARAELAETDWLQLLPASDRQALENMPEISHDTAEGEGVFSNKGGESFSGAPSSPLMKAMIR